MDLRAIFMGLAFALMWSSAFTSARIIVTDAPPLLSLALRFALSGIIAVILARLLGQSWRISRGEWRVVVIFGICQNALYLGMNFVAMQWIEASLAAIIASSMPLLVALIGWIVFGERVAALGVVGLIAGMLGAALIMGSRLQAGGDALGITLCVIAALALAVATLAARGVAAGKNVLMIVGLQMFVGSAILAVISVASEVPEITWSWKLIFAFLYTTLVPGVLATWVWFVLVGRIGSVRASTFHFLNPFFGVAVAAVLLGEQIGGMDVVGVCVIAAGILAVQMSKVRGA